MTKSDTTHACPGRCGQRVPRRLLACREDWWRLPSDLRRAVLAHKMFTPEHRAAVADALAWYRAHPYEIGAS